MLVTIIVFVVGLFLLSASITSVPKFKDCKDTEGRFIMLEECIVPGLIAIGFFVVGGFLLKENVDNKVNDIIENTEFYPDDYNVKCKVVTIDNKSDTTYFLERKKHKKK